MSPHLGGHIGSTQQQQGGAGAATLSRLAWQIVLLVLAAASAASGIQRALKLPKLMWQSHVQDLGLETYPKMSPHLCGHIGSAQQQQGDADDDPRGRAPRQLRELKSPPGGFQGRGEAAELHPAGLAGQGDSHIAGGHAGLHMAQVS